MSGSARQKKKIPRRDVRRYEYMTTLENEYTGVVPYRKLKIVDAWDLRNDPV